MTHDQEKALEGAKAKISEIKLDLESLADDVKADTDNDSSEEEGEAIVDIANSLDSAEDEITNLISTSKANKDKSEEEKA